MILRRVSPNLNVGAPLALVPTMSLIPPPNEASDIFSLSDQALSERYQFVEEVRVSISFRTHKH